MAEPQDMILPMLREMKAEHAAFRAEVQKSIVDLREEMRAGFTRIEASQKNIRSALAGDTVFNRMLVGEHEERLDAIERKVTALEGQQ